MKWNEQQQHAISSIAAGKNVNIRAVAGSGKSSTLAEAIKQYVEKNKKSAAVLMFNVDAAGAMRGKLARIPKCKVATLNAYSYSEMIGRYPFIKESLSNFIDNTYFIKKYGISGYTTRASHINFSKEHIALLLKEWVSEFCKRPDVHFNVGNFPVKAFSEVVVGGEFSSTELQSIAKDLYNHIKPMALLHWNSIWNGEVDSIPHDAYLKKWFLEGGRITQDACFVDEYQDSNGLSEAIYARSSSLSVVGDVFQEIYEFRGTGGRSNCIEFDEYVDMNQSYRFGPYVAEVSTLIIQEWLGSDKRVIGNPSKNSSPLSYDSKMSNFDAIVCRSRSGVLECAMHLAKSGVPFKAEGISFGSMSRLIMNISALQEKKNHDRSIFPAGVGSYYDLISVYNSGGIQRTSDLGVALSLYDKNGKNDSMTILNKLKSMESSREGTLVTTTHKAKGLEFSKVRVHNDYSPPYRIDGNGLIKKAPKWREEEGRLAYVAVSRAIDGLAVPDTFPTKSDNIRADKEPCF